MQIKEKVIGGLSQQQLISDDSVFFLFGIYASFQFASVHMIEEVSKGSPTGFPLCLSLSPSRSLSFCVFALLPARRKDNILDKPSTDKWMPAAAL